MSCEGEVERAIRHSGCRVTVQRSRILSTLRHSGGHQSADDIHVSLMSSDPHSGISLSTVYRTLETLQASGLVSALDAGTGTMVYEWADLERPHHHLVCRECGEVQQIALEGVERLEDEIQVRSSFTPDIRHMGIGGLCAACAEAQERRERGE